MDINEEKNKPFEIRRALAVERIKKVLNDLDIDIAPIIASTSSTLQAKLLYVDMQNPEMLKNLGLEGAPNANIKEQDEKLSN